MTLRRLAKYGYDSIEISGEPDHYDTREVRRLLGEHGIRCWGAVAIMSGERNLLARDEARRAASVQYIKDCVTMVKELDGEIMSVVPCTVGKISPDASPTDEWRWAVESMQEVYAHAQAEGVRVGVEPLNRFETYFINRAEQALALAEATGPSCGVVLDTFHMNIEEADMLAAIRSAGDRLVDFHVADNNRLACGQGRFDWPEIIQALQETGYDGALAVEFVAPVDRTPVADHPHALECGPVDISPQHHKFIKYHGGDLLTEEFYSDLVRQCAEVLRPLIQPTAVAHQ